MKNKKTNLIGMRTAIFVVVFTFLFIGLKVQAINNPVSSCYCKETVDATEHAPLVYVSSAEECNQACANKDKHNKFFAFTAESAYSPVTKNKNSISNTANHICSCSSNAPYDNAITGTFSIVDEAACIKQCQGSSSKVYQYDKDSWKDVPVAVVEAEKPRQFDYSLLEQFPGFYNKDQVLNDFPGLILSIYKFGIWTVGIAGLFMLVVGGFTYMTSAGNTSTAGGGKKIIWDALLGIVAALGAYLILYVINPDLTRITIGDSFVSVDITEGSDMSAESSGKLQSGTAGSCGGLSTQTSIDKQCGEASSQLAGLLSCISKKLPSAIITSISDSGGYGNCIPSRWTDANCAHAKFSCHYGGQTCFSVGKSYGVDLSTRNLSASQLITAAHDCGASYTKDESVSANHVHASVGKISGCGCN